MLIFCHCVNCVTHLVIRTMHIYHLTVLWVRNQGLALLGSLQSCHPAGRQGCVLICRCDWRRIACKFTWLRVEFTSCGCRTEGLYFLSLSESGACGGAASAPRAYTAVFLPHGVL